MFSKPTTGGCAVFNRDIASFKGRYCRTLQDAFPDERACAVEHFKRDRNRIGAFGEKAVIALVIVFCGFWIAGIV